MRAQVPDERSQAVGPITTTGPDESDSSRALTFHDYLAAAALLTNVHAGGGRGSTVMTHVLTVDSVDRAPTVRRYGRCGHASAAV